MNTFVWPSCTSRWSRCMAWAICSTPLITFPSHSGQVSGVSSAYLEGILRLTDDRQIDVPAEKFVKFTTVDKTSFSNIDVSTETEIFHLFEHTRKMRNTTLMQASNKNDRTRRYSILPELDFHSVWCIEHLREQIREDHLWWVVIQ